MKQVQQLMMMIIVIVVAVAVVWRAPMTTENHLWSPKKSLVWTTTTRWLHPKRRLMLRIPLAFFRCVCHRLRPHLRPHHPKWFDLSHTPIIVSPWFNPIPSHLTPTLPTWRNTRKQRPRPSLLNNSNAIIKAPSWLPLQLQPLPPPPHRRLLWLAAIRCPQIMVWETIWSAPFAAISPVVNTMEYWHVMVAVDSSSAAFDENWSTGRFIGERVDGQELSRRDYSSLSL